MMENELARLLSRENANNMKYSIFQVYTSIFKSTC